MNAALVAFSISSRRHDGRRRFTVVGGRHLRRSNYQMDVLRIEIYHRCGSKHFFHKIDDRIKRLMSPFV
jgi:hypothetical protein